MLVDVSVYYLNTSFAMELETLMSHSMDQVPLLIHK